ncbi:MAG: hypothetical protein CEE42_14925 [Promethearchaeota archaeon Loki_b31]|nr:MAG: hypothetical protein CEE42_14925 [Candidatus Lokiarchaeota archaeon Loki_b31]
MKQEDSIFDDHEDYITFFEQSDNDYFFEWYSLEGSESLIELSRQFRTFFNYKYLIIRSKFSRINKSTKIANDDKIISCKNNIFNLSSQLINLLNEIGVENGNIIEKIQILEQKVGRLPTKPNTLLLKKIKILGEEIWKNLHIISELELYYHPKLLKIAISVANIVSSVKGAYNLILLDFFIELRRNYLQLEKEIEISNSYIIDSEKYNEKREMRSKVRI